MDTLPTPDWQSDDESVKLFCADCLTILPLLPKGSISAVVTDPPYGINHARDRKSQVNGWIDYPDNGWDRERASREQINAILSLGIPTCIWGGNYFTDYLPPSSKWLIWDKGQTDFSLADCELAWCSWGGAVRRITYARAKAMSDGKIHPTQKALDVMMWNMLQLPAGCDTILDPYMGSGTTIVACVRSGRRAIGIERSEHYFEASKRRIAAAIEQHAGGPMFANVKDEPQLFAEDAA